MNHAYDPPQPLFENRAQLNVKEHPVNWFTCITVGPGDYPWEPRLEKRKQAELGADSSDEDEDEEADDRSSKVPRTQNTMVSLQLDESMRFTNVIIQPFQQKA